MEAEPDPAFARRARIVLENLQLEGKQRVLDLGCGRGFYLRVLRSCWPDLELCGVDLNQRYLTIAKEVLKNRPVRLIRANAISLPFEDNFFNRIIASEILEHIQNDSKAIDEIYRVLRPKGITMITVPNKKYPFSWDPINWLLERLLGTHIHPSIWWLAGIWADHERLYDKDELAMKLRTSGFKIEKVWQSTHYCLPFSHFFLYGIGKNLVEKGLFEDFDRFTDQKRQSWPNRILLWPVRRIDKMNEGRDDSCCSVNLIVKVRK